MRRRIIKASAYAVISVAAVILISAAAFYYRLSRGPVSLNALTETVQHRINANLTDMTVSIGGVVLELPPGGELPSLRLRDLVLLDPTGNVIARAPRAAVGLDTQALWSLSVVPKTLELIGPRIFVKRNLTGGIELGFGNLTDDQAAAATEATPPADADGKSDRQPASESAGAPGDIVPNVPGAKLIQVLSGAPDSASAGIGSMEDIRVTAATITLYDEPNNAIWNAQTADLAFRRMPYGFVVVTTASIANGSQPGNWHAEISTSYKRQTRSFSTSARFYDLVPANISEKIFALSQLARVKVPLSGHAELEINEDGSLSRGTAEFAAAAGEVGFPDYLAQPVIVDEGSLRAEYDPASGGVAIKDSSLLVGGSRAELTGSILPVRNAEGRLTAMDITLGAHNVSLDTQGTVTEPVSVDRVDFSGRAGIETPGLDINDLVIMKGNAGVRLRGSVTPGEKSAGLMLSGRVRDLSADLLKKLWPPIVAPKTRNWVNLNVKDGRISDGSLQINLPADALYRAQQEQKVPAGAIDVRFNVEDVTSSYYRGLPALTNGSGSAQLDGNVFTLTVGGATIDVPNAGPLKIASGTMTMTDIIAPETMGDFQFTTQSKVAAALGFLSQPDLNLIASSGVDTSKLGGDIASSVHLTLPLIKDVPRERVNASGSAKLTNTSLVGALDKVDITDGTFDLTMKKSMLDAQGTAKLNGIDAKITWHRDAGKGAKQSATIAATLDDKDLKKLGVELTNFMQGPVTATLTLPDLSDRTSPLDVKADLSKVAMKIDSVGWSREATKGTTGELTYYGAKSEGGRRVKDLAISGPGVSIKGDVLLSEGGGMKEVRLGKVVLGDNNNFSMTVRPGDGATAVSIIGKEFDARPIIKSLFGGPPKTPGGDSNPQPITINANVDRVYVNRGEEVRGLTATITSAGSMVTSADMAGTFVSGQPIVLRVTPVADGRELQVTGRDAGAALRAANLYSKIAGGQIDFRALMANNARSTIKKGNLVIRDFDVRNEAALAELDQKGKPKKSGPRKDGISFRKLTLPFTTDDKFLRIGNSLVQGPDLGATFGGLIRKADSAMDITGTIIPAYALNAALGEIPLVGDILTGGKGQGIIGITFALSGTVENSKFQVNPVSAIAPGFLRKMFEFERAGKKPKAPLIPQGGNK